MQFSYHTALFDLDGTLVDTSPGITRSVQYALAAEGINEPDLSRLLRFIGPPLWQSFSEFYGFDTARSERAVQTYRERYTAKGVHEAKLYDGIEALLRALRAGGVRLATASSKPECFVRDVLEEQGILSYFDAVVGSELDGRRSDKCELIEEALRRLGVKTHSGVVMIGDRCFDLEGARAAQVDFIGVLFGFGTPQELSGYSRARLAHSPEDVLRLCRADR